MKLFRKILVVLFFLSAPAVFSQENFHRSDSIVTIDGIDFYHHIVTKGETAFGISKQYQITLDKFYEINPQAMYGIRLGEALLIPIIVDPPPLPQESAPQTASYGDQLFIYHRVKKGETYYGIATLYQIKVEDIRRANPEFTNVLPEGVSLRIPYDQNILTGIKIQQDAANTSDGTYIVHTGETLQSIASVLNTTTDELIKANPDITQGLRSGDAIRIPSKQAKVEEAENEDSYPIHIVKQGETVYSISRYYGINTDSLLLYNFHISDNRIGIGDTLVIPYYRNIFGFIEYRTEKRESLVDIANRFMVPLKALKAKNPGYSNMVPKGRIIFIPVEQQEPELPGNETLSGQDMESAPGSPDLYVSKDTICIGRFDPNKTFTVALMMPFATNRLKSDSFSDMKRKNKVSDYIFFDYISFYQGVLIALDDLKAEGINIRLNVYDVSGPPEQMDHILGSPEMKRADLVIGMIRATFFKKVADFTCQNNIPLINVASARDDILTGYSNVAKIAPTDVMIPETITDLLPNDKNINLIIVRSNEGKFSNHVALLKAKYPYCKEVFIGGGKTSSVSSQLSSSEENYVVVMDDNKLEILDMMRILDEKKKQYRITMIGYPEWDKIPELSYHYAQNLKLHFITPQLIDYTDEETNEFILHFRARFNNEPDPLAFQGYDIVSYFLHSLSLFGRNCIPCAQHIPYHFISTQNMIFENAPGNGYNNLYWNIYTIKDYNIRIIEH